VIETAVAAFQLPDVRRQILFTIGLPVVFRAVAHIPLPGVNTELLADFFAGNQLLGFMNLLSGGALENFSVVALGVYPYVTANIASTVLVPLIPPLQELSREGESGRRKIAQWTRLATIPFAMLQGFGQIQILRSAQQGLLSPTLGAFDILVMLIVMTAGTMFSAGFRPRSSSRSTRPLAAMTPSVVNSTPTSTSPPSKAATVRGPPTSRGLNSANTRPYTLSRPGRQLSLSGHSGGPPNTRSEACGARSLTLARPRAAAVSPVTTNPFLSCAGA